MQLETKLTINDQTFVLAYDWEAQVKAEEMTGVNLLAPPPNSAGFRAIFLSRLLKHQPNITLEKVNSLMPLNLDKISSALHQISETQEAEEDLRIEVQEVA
jgi:hypothetical protein